MKSLPHIQETPKTAEGWLGALLKLAHYLRSPAGCPWDREQTTASFAHFLQEEAQELDEAIAHGDNDHIAEELGDTLFTVLMTAVVAADEGRLDLETTLERTHAKMIRRHAHLFGEETAETAEDVAGVWHRVKEEEQRAREDA